MEGRNEGFVKESAMVTHAHTTFVRWTHRRWYADLLMQSHISISFNAVRTPDLSVRKRRNVQSGLQHDQYEAGASRQPGTSTSPDWGTVSRRLTIYVGYAAPYEEMNRTRKQACDCRY